MRIRAADANLRSRGVLFAGIQNAAKARIQLMLALAKAGSREELQALIEQGLYS